MSGTVKAWVSPRPGDLLAGKYRVERVIGQGGMGVVLSAIHEQLEDRVAIKMLLPEVMGDQEVVQRFWREARLVKSLRSEQVVRVLDFGQLTGEVPFLVLEYLEGQDLGARLEQLGPRPVTEAVDLVLQAMVALAEAHAAGLVHRDLKPANLFLTSRPDGSPLIKVLDFGISKRIGTDKGSDLTQATGVMGSPMYMSPEQLRSTKHVDARSDLWALGVTLFELITGRCPFEGKTLPAVLFAIAADPPLTFAETGVQVDPGLAAVVARCLEKRPDDRFESVLALAEALAPFAGPTGERSAESIAGVSRQPVRPSPLPERFVAPTPLSTQGNWTESSPSSSAPAPAPPPPPARRPWLALAPLALLLGLGVWSLGGPSTPSTGAAGAALVASTPAPATTASTAADEASATLPIVTVTSLPVASAPTPGAPAASAAGTASGPRRARVAPVSSAPPAPAARPVDLTDRIGGRR